MYNPHIGVLGASGLVGSSLITLLAGTGRRVTVFSRRKISLPNDQIQWRQLSVEAPVVDTISHWVSLIPIWVLPAYGTWLRARGVQRIVALSSTSCLVKDKSADPYEQAVARKLAEGELYLRRWGRTQGVKWLVLRPTLIYGDGVDKNISEIAAMAKRLGFFPLMGKAEGKRQPVHAQDVAAACVAALDADHLADRAYNLAGGETLTYREMVTRVFAGLGREPILPSLPAWMFRLALICLRVFPRYRRWSMAMVDRMNQDLVFDHSDAVRDFGYTPREKFQIMRPRV
jgi:nucleoside-diphosphate-sugar epimerase